MDGHTKEGRMTDSQVTESRRTEQEVTGGPGTDAADTPAAGTDAADTDSSNTRATDTDAPDTGARAAGDRVRWDKLDLVWCLALVLLAFTITTLGVVRATSLSPLDEASHLDYAWSVSHGTLPSAGSTMAPEVLKEWSCRSQEGAQYIIPPCGEAHPPSDYPVRGENYNYGHPPTYYTVTGLLARAGDALPFGITFTTSARLTGALWLSAALIGLYLLVRVWRMPRLLAVAAAVVMASVPSVAHASSIVTNDAPGTLAGVLAFWVLTRVAVQGRLGWLLPTALALFVASIKVMHSVALLAVAGVLLVMAIAAFRAGDRGRGRSLGFISAGIVAATGLVHLGWSTFQGTRGDPNWLSPVEGINTKPVEGAPLREWLPTLFSGFGITQTFWLQAALTSFAVLATARLLGVLLTASPFVTVSAFPAGDRRRLVGWVVLLGCAVVPLVVQVQAYLNGQDYFPGVSSRYSISLLPMALAGLVFIVQARRWRVATIAVTAFCLGSLLLSFGGFLTV
jgi:hypothetical protein